VSILLNDEMRSATATISIQLTTVEEQIRARGRDRSGASSTLDQLQAEIEAGRRSERDKNASVDALEVKIADVREKLRKLNEEHDSLQAALEEAQTECGGASDHTRELELRYDKERRQMEHLASSLNKLVEDKQNLQASMRQASIGAFWSYLVKLGRELESAMQDSSEASRAAKARQALEEARHRDPDVMALMESRGEWRKMLDLANVPAVRTGVEKHLQEIEKRIDLLFPGALTVPAGPSDMIDVEEIYYQTDADEAVVILPVRNAEKSEWSAHDPASIAALRLTWALSKALQLSTRDGDVVRVGKFVGLRVPLHRVARKANDGAAMPMPGGRTISLLLSRLPTQVDEAFRREDQI